KIVVSAEPERSEGEATIAQNPNFENWRDIVNDVRTIIQNYSGYIHIPDLQPQLATYPTI
ncbi:hypothetical protein COY59_03105, partial [Candidatus Gottesmanbacteria bacterium CG_4_10_14_0_8_um_filter_37_24]